MWNVRKRKSVILDIASLICVESCLTVTETMESGGGRIVFNIFEICFRVSRMEIELERRTVAVNRMPMIRRWDVLSGDVMYSPEKVSWVE